MDAGRGQVIVGSQLTPPTTLIAELLSTAVLSVIRARMLAADPEPLTALAPSLMEFIVEPYLGAGAASADRAQGPVASAARAGRGEDPPDPRAPAGAAARCG